MKVEDHPTYFEAALAAPQDHAVSAAVNEPAATPRSPATTQTHQMDAQANGITRTGEVDEAGRSSLAGLQQGYPEIIRNDAEASALSPKDVRSEDVHMKDHRTVNGQAQDGVVEHDNDEQDAKSRTFHYVQEEQEPFDLAAILSLTKSKGQVCEGSSGKSYTEVEDSGMADIPTAANLHSRSESHFHREEEGEVDSSSSSSEESDTYEPPDAVSHILPELDIPDPLPASPAPENVPVVDPNPGQVGSSQDAATMASPFITHVDVVTLNATPFTVLEKARHYGSTSFA